MKATVHIKDLDVDKVVLDEMKALRKENRELKSRAEELGKTLAAQSKQWGELMEARQSLKVRCQEMVDTIAGTDLVGMDWYC